MYYQLLRDKQRFANQWHLDEPHSEHGEEIDAREFRYGRKYMGRQPVDVPILRAGKPVAFSLAAFDMPVVNSDIASILVDAVSSSIELYPVTVAKSHAGYSILNVIHQEACVDETRTEVTRWTAEDDAERAGRLRVLSNLTIDPTRTHRADIFRVEDFVVALVVSEKLKLMLDKVPDLGIVFDPVC